MEKNMLNDYESFKVYWSQYRQGALRSGENLFKFLNLYMASNETLGFYVKNFNSDNEEIHILAKDSVLIVNRNKKALHVRKHLLNLSEVSFSNQYDDYKNTTLTLFLANGAPLVYSAMEDTNDDWYREYSEQIEFLSALYL